MFVITNYVRLQWLNLLNMAIVKEKFVVELSLKQAKELGIVFCKCGHMENNHCSL